MKTKINSKKLAKKNINNGISQANILAADNFLSKIFPINIDKEEKAKMKKEKKLRKKLLLLHKPIDIDKEEKAKIKKEKKLRKKLLQIYPVKYKNLNITRNSKRKTFGL